jgi:hypothetical protein
MVLLAWGTDRLAGWKAAGLDARGDFEAARDALDAVAVYGRVLQSRSLKKLQQC